MDEVDKFGLRLQDVSETKEDAQGKINISERHAKRNEGVGLILTEKLDLRVTINEPIPLSIIHIRIELDNICSSI